MKIMKIMKDLNSYEKRLKNLEKKFRKNDDIDLGVAGVILGALVVIIGMVLVFNLGKKSAKKEIKKAEKEYNDLNDLYEMEDMEDSVIDF